MPPKDYRRINAINGARELDRERIRRLRRLQPDLFISDDDEEEEEADEDEIERMLMMRNPIPRNVPVERIPLREPRRDPEPDIRAARQVRQGVQQRAREQPAPHLPMRRIEQRQAQLPRGLIRYANNNMRQSVSWMFTVRLYDDPEMINYMPTPPAVENIYVDDEGVPARVYVVPTVDQIRRAVGQIAAPVFILYQLEQGINGLLDDNGHGIFGDGYHYQGYMEFTGKVTATEICRVMGWRPDAGWNMLDIWLEPRGGTRDEAIAYVTKDETAVFVPQNFADLLNDENQDIEHINNDEEGVVLQVVEGEPRPEGGEEAVEEIVPLVHFRVNNGVMRPMDAVETNHAVLKMIQENPNYKAVLEKFPGFVLSKNAGVHAAIQTYKARSMAMRNVQVFVHWGDSRTGKSRAVGMAEGELKENGFYEMDPDKVYIKNDDETYWQKYDSHPVLFIDEMVPVIANAQHSKRWDIKAFLNVLDGQPLPLAIKYNDPVNAAWTKVYITSNHPPRAWFPGASPANIRALYRRLETGGITKYVDGSDPELLEAHQLEVASGQFVRDRPNVVIA